MARCALGMDVIRNLVPFLAVKEFRRFSEDITMSFVAAFVLKHGVICDKF